MPDQDRAHPGNAPASPPAASQQRPRPARDLTRSPWVPVLVVLASLILWELAARLTIPILLPPPADVAEAFWKSAKDGSLFRHIGASYFRILTGWFVGCVIAIPFGILAGRLKWVRAVLDPFIEFFRFIPPIAFVTLFMIWFGLGEVSKVGLIVYTAFFTTFLSTMAGAMGVEIERIRAAQCLGASPRQVFFRVIVPGTVPHIVTGVRLSLGLAFMTVVAAEFIAAESGVGYLIFSARLFAQTDFVFLGILVLGVMGFVANSILKRLLARIAYRYDVNL
ncbi:MAG: ABC transporter permease [Betaproteobacteria bacterium]|nr:ABC transporter permease [Betaproteobacteria bacterium]MBK9607958.1 ABC transporter permease [Betaproteobacteria bacterium]